MLLCSVWSAVQLVWSIARKSVGHLNTPLDVTCLRTPDLPTIWGMITANSQTLSVATIGSWDCTSDGESHGDCSSS